MGRWWIALVLVLAGCDGDDAGNVCVYEGQTYPFGATFPAGDGCNTCSCDEYGVACTLIACPDAGVGCLPSGGCAVGPRCGEVCCDTGEACIDGECRCGDLAACGSGDSCEAAGPVGKDGCGAVCCGTSGPCPQ